LNISNLLHAKQLPQAIISGKTNQVSNLWIAKIAII
jgi:hypothetical protein